VNQAWAGHPGAQVFANAVSNSATEVWTKPLGGQRTAVFMINTAVHNGTVGPGEGHGVAMTKCNASKPAQTWFLSPGVAPGDGSTTNVNSTLGHCWEIGACNTRPGAGLGAYGGCKPVPHPGTCATNKCACNGAWAFEKNGSITSVMDGMCLTASGTHLDTMPCTTKNAKHQQFVVKPSTLDPGAFTIQQGEDCADTNPDNIPPELPGGPANMTINLADLKLGFTGPAKVRDVWNKKDLGTATETLSTTVPFHGSVFLVLMPVGSEWPLKFQLAPWMRSPAPPVPPALAGAREDATEVR